MKKLIIVSVFVLLAAEAGAQGMEHMRRRLSQPDPATGSRIEVREEADASRLVSKADRITRQDKVIGYRVSLFRDNSQTAGENARSVAAQFQARFPYIPVQTSYESPYFKVTVGNFVDKADAIALRGRVLSEFPKAVVIQETISLSDMAEQQVTETGNNDPDKIFGD